MRILSRTDIEALQPSPKECMQIAQHVVDWQVRGLVDSPPKLGVYPPNTRHFHAMPAFLPRLNAVGAKWLADVPANRDRGLPTVMAIVILNDSITGRVLAVMDATLLTALRTAAVTGVAIRACAASGSRRAVVVGTGVEAQTHVVMLPHALPSLAEISVVGRNAEAAEEFCKAFQGKVQNCVLSVGAERESAIRNAEVIITVTSTTDRALIAPEWVQSGGTVIVLDNPFKETRLLRDIDRIVVDDRALFLSQACRNNLPDALTRVDAEIGEVLQDVHKGRATKEQRVAIFPLGMSALDIAMADELYQRAEREGIGHVLSL